MRPETCAYSGIQTPSTPSRDIRSSVRTGVGPRISSMKRPRSAGSASRHDGSACSDSASARSVCECRPRTCGLPAQQANRSNTRPMSPPGQTSSLAAR